MAGSLAVEPRRYKPLASSQFTRHDRIAVILRVARIASGLRRIDGSRRPPAMRRPPSFTRCRRRSTAVTANGQRRRASGSSPCAAGPHSESAPALLSGDPIMNEPAGTTTISGPPVEILEPLRLARARQEPALRRAMRDDASDLIRPSARKRFSFAFAVRGRSTAARPPPPGFAESQGFTCVVGAREGGFEAPQPGDVAAVAHSGPFVRRDHQGPLPPFPSDTTMRVLGSGSCRSPSETSSGLSSAKAFSDGAPKRRHVSS